MKAANQRHYIFSSKRKRKTQPTKIPDTLMSFSLTCSKEKSRFTIAFSLFSIPIHSSLEVY